MSLDQQMRWAENWALILELWPDWAPTDAQQELWRKRLNDCAQGRLKDAIENTATNLIGLKPRLSSILKAYKEAGHNAVACSVHAPDVLPDSHVEQDMIDMRRELEAMEPATLLSNLRSAAPLAVVRFSGGVGPEAAGVRIAASKKIIDEYENKPVRDWPPMIVGFVWANAHEGIPF